MSDFFVGEIRLFSMNWNPQDWKLCDGSIMQIQQYAALYALLGTAFGGNGQTTFALPDLRGRVVVGGTWSGTYKTGAAGGLETVVLTADQVAPHAHSVSVCSVPGTAMAPSAGCYISSAVKSPQASTPPNLFSPDQNASTIVLNQGTVATGGASAAHNNIQPSTVLNYCIAVSGIFPPRN